jgi:decaprenylphospho-beta-D-erythro-pentofuranosid-2-ulose 2-reductase
MPTALILGASSDIGLAIARKFAREGYDIQLGARDPAGINSTRSDLSIRFNVQCSIYQFDADRTASHEFFFNQLEPSPEITIYCIGYMSKGKEMEDSWKETEKIISANYTGAVSILNIISRKYASQKKGIIVGISSVAGDRGRQSNFMYGSAKAGFSTYLSGLRNWLYPYGVHVVCVKPGFVYTKMTENLVLPALLTVTPEEVARAVYSASLKRGNIVYVKAVWRWIMLIIKLLPEPVFKKLKL